MIPENPVPFRVRLIRFLLGPLWIAFFAFGCDQDSSPPPPLPVEQLPVALEKAFQQAQGDAKALTDEIIASARAADYPKVFAGLQVLARVPGLTKEQTSVTSRGMLTVNGLLQTAQTQGDTKAADALKDYRKMK
jgi:hypothetical protein